MRRRFQNMSKKKKQVVSHTPTLVFAWIIGFLFTLAVLFISNFIGYEIMTQQTYTEISGNFSNIMHLITRFIKTPELVLSVMGGFLSFGLRYLFLFGKQYSV